MLYCSTFSSVPFLFTPLLDIAKIISRQHLLYQNCTLPVFYPHPPHKQIIPPPQHAYFLHTFYFLQHPIFTLPPTLPSFQSSFQLQHYYGSRMLSILACRAEHLVVPVLGCCRGQTGTSSIAHPETVFKKIPNKFYSSPLRQKISLHGFLYIFALAFFTAVK